RPRVSGSGSDREPSRYSASALAPCRIPAPAATCAIAPTNVGKPFGLPDRLGESERPATADPRGSGAALVNRAVGECWGQRLLDRGGLAPRPQSRYRPSRREQTPRPPSSCGGAPSLLRAEPVRDPDYQSPCKCG